MKLARSMSFATVVSIIVFLLFSSAAFAENRAGAITISPFFGKFLFDHDLGYDNDYILGIGAGYNFTKTLALELSAGRISTKQDTGAGREDATVNLYRMEGLYHFNPDGNLVPFIALGAGGLSLDREPGEKGRNSDFAADYGAGLKYFLNHDVAFRADVRHVINTRGEGMHTYNSDLLYTAGLTLLFGGEKAVVKAPVKEAAPAPAPVVEPVKKAPADSDGDGVPDDLDKCPGTPSGVAVDKDGCPVDSDNDGVADYLDKCPDTPKGAKVNKDGCPVDSDNDGVADYLDKCPGTPKGVKVDATGCPVPEKATVTAQGTYNFGIIYFDTGKSSIKAKSRPVLSDVVEFMEKNPDVKLEVQGYTDNVGSDTSNLKLSDARANAVRNYLIGKGIAADRLTAKGYGEANPAASNDTKEGREKNRRIEFKPIQ